MSETLEVDQRVATAREFVARVFSGHDPERARDFFTVNVVLHAGALGTTSGIDGVVSIFGAFIGALSDIDAAEQDVIASGDLVALRQVVSATHTGNLLGVPATGRRIQWDAVDIYRVTDDGRINEQWAFENLAAILSQAGAISLPWTSRPANDITQESEARG
jgi:predicted ester cyclase